MMIVLKKLVGQYAKMPISARAGMWFTLCSILQRGLSVISMPIFTRLFSTEAYGEYNLFNSWMMLFSLIVTLNLTQEVFNKGLIDHENERSDYSMSQATLVTVLVALFYLLYLLLRIPINKVTGMSTTLTSVMFVDIYATTIVSLWLACKRFDYAYRPLVAVTLGIAFSSVVLGVISVYFAPEEYKVLARVVSDTLPFSFAAACILFGLLRRSRCFYITHWWSKAIKLAIPLVPHYASQVLLNQADKIIIGWFLNASYVAIYGVAHSAGLLLVMINNGINASYVPWLYDKLKNGNYSSVSHVANSLAVAVLLPVFFLMILSPECVRLLATEDYLEAIWCIPPIATSVVFSFVYTLFVNVEIYYGKTWCVAVASILSAALNAVLNYWLIPRFGYISAAYVTSACYLATALLHLCFLRRIVLNSNSSIQIYDFRFLLGVCLAAIVCAGVAICLYLTGVFRYAFVLLMLAVAYRFRNKISSIARIVRRADV